VWYVARDGATDGPFDFDTLLALYRAGDVSQLDLVWRDGLDNWCPLWDVPQFRQAQKAALSGAISARDAGLARPDSSGGSGVRAAGTAEDGGAVPPVGTASADPSGLLASSATARDASPARSSDAPAEGPTRRVVSEPVDGERSGNIVLNHWRGKYSLGFSYWVIGIGLSLVALWVTYGFGAIMEQADISPGVVGASLLSFFTVLLVFTVWQLIGVWRSAGNSFRQGRLMWPLLARGMVVVGALRLGAEFATVIGPMAWESLHLAFAGDRIPPAHLRIEEDGRIITLAGGIPYGTGARFATLLAASNDVRVLRLHSIGGLFNEAQKIADLVHTNGLTTFTNGECSSACTAILLGARDRVVAEGAKVGFHGMSFGSLDERRLPGMSEPARRFYVDHGLPESFVERVLRVPNDNMEYVTAGQLVELNIATRVVARKFDYRRLAYWPDEMARLIVERDATPLPMRLDKMTTLTELSAEDTKVIYTYNVDAAISRIDLAHFESGMLKRLGEGACQDEGMRRAMEDGITYIHRYVAQKERHIADVTVDRSVCQE
jgi:hypothetical protein